MTTAAEVKDALRRRHPAVEMGMVGEWTTLEEWRNIDLLAISAWTRGTVVGYEVKVDRADYRRELARPQKRAGAVARCDEFYFAVPWGLLKAEEIAWVPPVWLEAEAAPLDRPPCPGAYGAFCDLGRVRFGTTGRQWRHESRRRGRRPLIVAVGRRQYDAVCPTCRGTGWLVESPAVRADAPRLWVPADVGLIVVRDGRCHVAKPAPRRKPDDLVSGGYQLRQLVRWVSVRPDPRHAALRKGPVDALSAPLAAPEAPADLAERVA